jgi:beta-lactamase regulating signal transducer with metallopeptidase domain
VDFLLDLVWKNVAVAGVLALVAAIVGRYARRPALTHALWLLVMLKLVTPPLWQLPLPWPAGNVEIAEAQPVVEPSESEPGLKAPAAITERVTRPGAGAIVAENLSLPVAPTDQTLLTVQTVPAKLPALERSGALDEPSDKPLEAKRSWLTWQNTVLAIWLAGSSLWLIVFLVRLRRFRQLVRFATPASPVDAQRVKELAEKIGLHRPPTLRLLNARVPPMTWGFAQRREILVPAHLWNTLPAAQRDALVLHELAHLRRGDHWVRQFELLVFVLHWWHPVSWWARHELQKAEEECCDAMVVRGIPEIAGDYAELIVETVAYLAQPPSPALPPLASGLGHIRHLRKRLTSILGGSAAPRLSLLAWLILAITGVFLLPMIPTTSREALANAVPERGLSLGDGASRKSGANSEWMRATTDAGSGEQVLLDSAEENLAIMKLQLVQREAELTEERLLLEQAAKISSRDTALVARGAAALDVLEQSLRDQKIREARILGREAAVKELNLLIRREESRMARERSRQIARADVEHSQTQRMAESHSASSTEPSEQHNTVQVKRIDRLEHRLDTLISEARALAEELRRERSTQK